ncbi:MAG: hypothetical protein EZS28_055251 [Streblomastix strix]|uniref:Uncharacterized protein n=1 Tax=Streblomastix strix TaxID=222440 RepID=A0A5J4Q4D0_9EUKA|nr:MAG: hypothetical protein EZS28_055251 [Streblomastix strix]
MVAAKVSECYLSVELYCPEVNQLLEVVQYLQDQLEDEILQRKDEEDDLVLIVLNAHLELEQVLCQNLWFQRIKKLIWRAKLIVCQSQPDVAKVGVGCFDYCLGVGVLFDFQESGFLTN